MKNSKGCNPCRNDGSHVSSNKKNSQALSNAYMKICEMNEIIMIKSESRGDPSDSHRPAQGKTIADLNNIK